MKTNSNFILSTSPQAQPVKRIRSFANLDHRQRYIYGRTRRNNTGKELDNETGLYYYGARYMDPKISRWLSGDPAMGEYVPSAPVNDEARKRNGSLPGMGGVFNCVNLHVYHYAGNNPVNYVDPDGRENVIDWTKNTYDWFKNAAEKTMVPDTINKVISLKSIYRQGVPKQENMFAVIEGITKKIGDIGDNIINHWPEHLVAGLFVSGGFILYKYNGTINNLANYFISGNNYLKSIGIDIFGGKITHNFRLGSYGEYNMRIDFFKEFDDSHSIKIGNAFNFNISPEFSISAEFGLKANIPDPIRKPTFGNIYLNIGLFYSRSFW
jgi:RHS repeat-associated protein